MTPEQILKQGFISAKGLYESHGGRSPVTFSAQNFDDFIIAFAKALQGDGEPVAWMWDNDGITEYTQDIHSVEYYSSIYGIEMTPLFTYSPDQLSKIAELELQLAKLQLENEKMREAIKEMVEDGWLMHGVEGMSKPQQLVYDVYIEMKLADSEG